MPNLLASRAFSRVDPGVHHGADVRRKMPAWPPKMWPRGMHSASGFIEPGEAIEEAVARETLEEVGLIVREVRMYSTQPWPFPHSLMIGVLCEVERIARPSTRLNSRAAAGSLATKPSVDRRQTPGCVCPAALRDRASAFEGLGGRVGTGWGIADWVFRLGTGLLTHSRGFAQRRARDPLPKTPEMTRGASTS